MRWIFFFRFLAPITDPNTRKSSRSPLYYSHYCIAENHSLPQHFAQYWFCWTYSTFSEICQKSIRIGNKTPKTSSANQNRVLYAKIAVGWWFTSLVNSITAPRLLKGYPSLPSTVHITLISKISYNTFKQLFWAIYSSFLSS